MREIKFRAWEPLNEKMIYFDGFIPFTIGERYVEGTLSSQNQEKRYLTTMNFDAIEIMQYAEFKDKSDNKIEVYEGDIIEEIGWEGDYYVVEFVDCAFYAKSLKKHVPSGLRTRHVKLDELMDIRVIGNKYENKELL